MNIFFGAHQGRDADTLHGKGFLEGSLEEALLRRVLRRRLSRGRVLRRVLRKGGCHRR